MRLNNVHTYIYTYIHTQCCACYRVSVQMMATRGGEVIVVVVGGRSRIIVDFSLNMYIQVSIFQELIIHFEMYFPLDLTFSFLLPLVKYHISPFTHNGECFQSIFLYLPNNTDPCIPILYDTPSPTELTFGLS